MAVAGSSGPVADHLGRRLHYWLLVAAAAGLSGAVVVTIAVRPDPWPLVELQVRGSKLLALFGSLVAAFTFARGAYLRRAWLFVAAAFALLLERDALVYRGVLGDGAARAYLDAGAVIAANTCAVLGTWMLARAWHRAGIGFSGSRLSRGLLRAAAVGLAVGITLPSLLIHLGQLPGDRAPAIAGIAANLGDILCLSMIAPALITAIALRGELVAWPWALFTASLLAWLFYDTALVVSGQAGDHASRIRGAAEAFRALAGALTFAAGVAQRLTARELGARLAGPGR